MKLNLVPTHVAKERANGGAFVVAGLLIVVGIVAAVLMISLSSSRLQKSTNDEQDALTSAANTKAVSDQADALMADKDVNMLVRDVNLAQGMEKHSSVYPDLYDKVRQYVPSYYRVTSMAATPIDDTSCEITLTGVLETYQEYADLGLALMRMPGAQTYSPSGYQVTNKYVPNLTPDDMTGTPIHPGEQNVPDDPTQRFEYMTRQGSLSSYQGVSGFGDESQTTKGPMPNASLVTITVTLKSDPLHHFDADIRTPDPRATLAAAASGAATSTTAAAGASQAFGTPGGTPPAQPAAPPADSGKGAGKNGKDDE